MASVEFEHIDKIYPGGNQAIFDFSLSIADGEALALVGPSGCGKSTLLRLLAGLETPSRGLLRIGGQVVNAQPPQQRNVAMVFQDYALYPHMTVRRNLEFPLRMRDLPRADIDRQVHWVTELLGLDGLLDRLPRQLSGGQRQRVAMGRALVRQPSVFLMDEPLSNLDARLRVQIRAELGELLERLGATTLYVTHDQAEAMTLGDRVAVLNQGRLQQVAPPRELYARPANVFVAGFIGNPPMNLLPARLLHDAPEGPRLRLGEQELLLPFDCSTVRLFDRLTAHSSQLRANGATPLHALTHGFRDCARNDIEHITAGIRPEHLRLSENGHGLRATVHDAEYLGHETLLYARLDGLDPAVPPLVARLAGLRPFHRGDPLYLMADAAQWHLFETDGRALHAPEEQGDA
ncbi:MAG TPA: ABC transporter ATP-binding protein [Candidatus Competibacteraceae bacterium]|nr:MAG: ABC transporter ATP-binding protein [Candidatus Competibacteraceae bacterium]HNW78823.1 ABC transporter ATP-binding protein [Candidatus Competibacteraceae bacterium]HQC72288.1 ABC transporter ATP-binding protein [Candidatus Competibacteraceae bacterium]